MRIQLLTLALVATTAASAQTVDVAWAGSTGSGAHVDGPAYELVSFVADPLAGGGVGLRWSTGAEPPNSLFTVQRSSDLLHWSTAFTYDGEGDGQGYTAYEAMDLAPMPGVSYYRLVATAGGRELEVSDDFAVDYRPVPAMRIRGDRDPGQFTVLADGPISELKLMNNRGQFMAMDLNYTESAVFVRAEGLAPGTYYVQAVVNGRPVMHTVLVTATGVVGS